MRVAFQKGKHDGGLHGVVVEAHGLEEGHKSGGVFPTPQMSRMTSQEHRCWVTGTNIATLDVSNACTIIVEVHRLKDMPCFRGRDNKCVSLMQALWVVV